MFRIKKLDIFISKQFGVLFIGTFFICQFVLMMQFLWRYIDELIGKGLSMEILAQFFWYMGLMLVPQAMPLAILLSSLITFGNLGESSELTAIKAAGISLIQSFRSLIVITVVISGISFYFQNNIGPTANMKIGQLLISMKQKSPEVEIPEGIFYDGIPNSNLYVQKKDIKTGMLYGVMIYRMTGSYEDQAIILADSAMLQATAEKKHLLLHLWSGEWFENMQTDAFGNSAAVPYRRETFTAKKIVLDFDGDFNMADATSLSNDARGKSLKKIFHDIDSLNIAYDSIGHAYYKDEKMGMYFTPKINKRDSLAAIRAGMANNFNIDSTYSHLPASQKSQVVNDALSRTQAAVNDLDFKSMITKDGDKIIHDHEIEAINKFTVALSCLIFFFIGAPLGAIIRKGGLGIPVIISVLVFIVYYILDNSGYRMARGGMWSVWFGKGLAPAVLTPIAVFVTYKANKDSVVFNLDLYKEIMRKILGLRIKRHVFAKEVVIEDPSYTNDAMRLGSISNDIRDYSKAQKLVGMPNPIDVFFKYHPDHEIKRISEELEGVINDLSNTRDNYIMSELNNYPVVSVKAHTRPFERKWLNIISAVLLPLGLFFYFRMLGFRIRLLRDLKTIKQTNDNIIRRISNIQTIK
ncbi:LptF/LptG family permease [Prevotella sp.]|uniref:LptF/LptG family permease n=1 Tax=Prevotella sp. TaxID=59823 RepID=UPI0026483D3D|nr:LptF/LptG family permease [Prevotella sp.]MDN5554356.1 LptF/LptG family permease [Prevotella sp.]